MALSILVTGAASGIGRHLAGALLRAGHNVLAADIERAAVGRAAVEEGWPGERLLAASLDVRDPAAWERALDAIEAAWGHLDALLNVAGVLTPGYVHETPAEQVDRHIDVNVKGVIYGTRAAARRMIPRRTGQIVNIASLAGVAPVPGIALYSASKFAVRGFSLAVAQELRPLGVRVTVICPDAVQTPMLDRQLSYSEAALTFSGPKILALADVEAAVARALRRAPLEITLPASRGALAKLGSAFPALLPLTGGLLRRLGLARQRRMRVKAGKSVMSSDK